MLLRLPISRIRVHLELLDNGDCALPKENLEKNKSFSVTYLYRVEWNISTYDKSFKPKRPASAPAYSYSSLEDAP